MAPGNYLQGLLLFVLLAAFMWGERVRSEALGTAVALAAVAGIAGAVPAPGLDPHKPWINFRAWAGTVARAPIDAFDWNQTYGPLHWPHSGHTVLTVEAEHADYWKAENLDIFNGYAWQIEQQLRSPARCRRPIRSRCRSGPSRCG